MSQVGDLDNVGQYVVAVVTEQGVGVEHDRAHRGDENYVQADHIQQSRLGEPPDVGGNRGNNHLDVHTGRADGRALPLVGQHPGIGNVAIQTRCEHQDHHAHLVALAAKMFAGQAVAELVNNLGQAQYHSQPEGVDRIEKLVKTRQFRVEDVEIHGYQRQGREGQGYAEDQGRSGKQPSQLGVKPCQQPLGVDALKADTEYVAGRAHDLFTAAFVAAFAKLCALAGYRGDYQAATVQHAHELLQFFERDLLRRELGLEPVLQLVETDLAVELLQDGVFFFLEAIVVQPYGLLHNPIALAQIVLLLCRQVWPLTDRHPAG